MGETGSVGIAPNPEGKTKRSKGYYWSTERDFCDYCGKRRLVRYHNPKSIMSVEEGYGWFRGKYLGHKPICWGCFEWVRLSVLK